MEEVTAMTSKEVFLGKAKSLFATGHPEESIQLFTKAEERGCNPVTVYLSRGAALLSIGELDKSIDDFNRVLEIDTDNERAFYYRGIDISKKATSVMQYMTCPLRSRSTMTGVLRSLPVDWRMLNWIIRMNPCGI